VKSRTFHLEFEDGSDIRGKMSEEVASQEEIALKHHYTAKIYKQVKIHYAMEKEDVDYTLLALSPYQANALPEPIQELELPHDNERNITFAEDDDEQMG
jgi:hypothetical protein